MYVQYFKEAIFELIKVNTVLISCMKLQEHLIPNENFTLLYQIIKH